LWVQVQAKDIQIVEGAKVLNDRVTLDNKSCRPSFIKLISQIASGQLEAQSEENT